MAIPDAAGSDRVQSLPIWLRAEWRPAESWRLDAVVGVSAFQEYELWNAQGVRQAKVDADPSLFLGASVSHRF